jgi:hypothetical protein
MIDSYRYRNRFLWSHGVYKVAGKEVAIKLEPAVNKQPSPLKHELKIYKTLMGGLGGSGLANRGTTM